jgi:hypothetical protein
LQKKYWLGETFENDFRDNMKADAASYTGSKFYGIILGLKSNTVSFEDHTGKQYTDYAKTGWIIAQDTVSGSNPTYSPETAKRLFRFVDRGSGDWLQSHVKVSIANIRLPQNEVEDPWATFDVVLRKIDDTDAAVKIVERFNACNLNPSSENYIVARIGNKNMEYSESKIDGMKSVNSLINQSL